MKKLLSTLPLILMILGCTQAPPPTDTADTAAIVAVTETWEAALNAKDIDGIAALYTSDARVLPPNAEMASGDAGLRAISGGVIDAGIGGEFTSIGARVAGDIGYDVGTYTFRVDGAVVDTGKWIVTFNRDDGVWRISNDIFNSDNPVAAPAE